MNPLSCFIVIFFVPFLALIVGFLLLVIKLIKKAKDSYWIGEIIDKKMNQRRDSETDRIETYCYLVVRTDTGKEMKVGLSKQMYDNFGIGDRVEKKTGELYPVKV